ncbi:lipase 3-like [Leptidea sinapis]|uniref:lipase 3-like n=1 Tax=Leptidea sinapis TaxID=189913 RepID=UPI0021C49D67|nr:lipase 3-like [Leptidea sinapis]
MWAINSFLPFKTGGLDGIFPGLLQRGDTGVLALHLTAIYRACLAHRYVPLQWREEVKVVFIPKPGNSDYTNPKSFRPISLTSFLMKTLERLCDRDIRCIGRALAEHNVDPTIAGWIDNMLRHRVIRFTVNTSTRCVVAPWNLVVDELIAELNRNKLYTVGYADDLAILITGPFENVLCNLMISAFQIIEEWCTQYRLTANPSKTELILFTNTCNFGNLTLPKLFNTEISLTKEVKNLGVILDSKLLWNKHKDHKLEKACYVTLAVARRSPNAEYVEQLIKETDFGSRFSDNLLEDAFLDANGLASKYGYPFEEHSVVTEDGYILGLHRIPHGRDKNNIPGERPAVLVMHGLLSSSADFMIMGPGNALAYILAEEGFDVWLGNARGNYYSRRHTFLNPNNRSQSFWDFSWDEIGDLDLPAIIDYILSVTRLPSIHYIGMSQGTTSFFVMGSMRPDYNKKITSMHALAPVAYMANTKSLVFRLISPHAKTIARVLSFLGMKEMLPNNIVFTWLGIVLCHDGSPLQPFCSALLFSIVGWSPNQFNSTMFPAKLGHAPAGCAINQFVHYAQSINKKDFRRFDYGSISNIKKYGQATPPKYNLSQITAPVILHYSTADPLSNIVDVERLYAELGGPAEMIKVPHDQFSHIDFMWGLDAKELLFDHVLDIMKRFELNDT